VAKFKSPLGFQLLQMLPGHGTDSQIAQVAWSPDGKLLASCATEGAIILWDVETGDQTRALREHEQPVYSLAWSPDGSAIASGSDDKTVKLWDPRTSRPLQSLLGHTDSVIALAWSPDGKRLASGGYDGTIRIWDPQSGEKASALGQGSRGIYGLAWSPDGVTLAAACYNRDIQLWDIQTGKMPLTLRGIEGSSTFSLAWSPSLESSLLAAGFWDGTIRLWDGRPDRGFPLYELHGHDAEIGALSFSHDGRLLASKSRDDTVRLWHCRTRQVLAVLRETTSEDWVGGIAFHPKESIVATLGTEDTMIRIWRLDVEALLGRKKPNRAPEEAIGDRRPRPAPRMDRVSVFVSYSRTDADYLNRLRVFLKPLERRRAGVLDIWDDTRIQPGSQWESELHAALESANVAVLLISADFLASEFISTVELPALLAKEREKGLAIVPVILKPCPFKRTRELAQFQAINPGLKSLLEMSEAEREAVWTSLVEEIEKRLP